MGDEAGEVDMVCPGQLAQLVGASSHTPKGCGFNFWSAHVPRLQVQFLVRTHPGGNRLMFLSHIDVTLFLLSCFSKINKHILR